MSIDLSVPPRLQKQLVGHTQSFQQLLEQHAAGRLHPAWLLAGQKGIGKATLAYQFVRYLLTAGQENAAFYNGLIDQKAHPNLFILERSADDDGKLETDIKIDKVRALADFARQSPAVPGWRVVIIDAIDELNRNAANSILKILEEPPQQLVFLMVCHSLGTILPTIRSRCCVLPLQPLTEIDFKDLGIVQESALLAELSGGSIGGYVALKSINVAGLLGQVIEIAQDVCQGRMQSLVTFCSGLDKKDARTECIPGLLTWLARHLVLYSAGITTSNELSDKINLLCQSAPTEHWLKAQKAISGFLEMSRGAYADPIHVIQALFLLLKSPHSYRS
ncbi:AAA family ATPase [Candidatus Odyssella acanthamoebae]|uniref:AAA family ATPase n=1 Tax=Candidatus Odyssella acanthamoebae TaxID=91604 RepID=UPI00068B1E79|nr:AAA family ATPase [Candidatus Paracaedibacter acanthamoebae]